MKSKKSLVALMVITSISMTGCLEDNYQGYPNDNATDGNGDGNGGGTTPETEFKLSWGVDLFHPDSTNNPANPYKPSPFDMEIKDAAGETFSVDGNLLDFDNGSIKFAVPDGSLDTFTPLHITTTSGEATYQFSADRAYDLSTSYNGNNTDSDRAKGTLQFTIESSSIDATPHATYAIEMSDVDGTRRRVDVTSAVVASMGSPAQQIKVPMHCFVKPDEDPALGVDITKVNNPFSMVTNGVADYKITKVRLIANSMGPKPGESNVAWCDSNSVVETTETSVLSQSFKGGLPHQGWAKTVTHLRGKPGYPGYAPGAEPQPSMRLDGIDLLAANGFDPTKNSMLIFQIDGVLSSIDTQRRDITHYMEKGELVFDSIVSKNPSALDLSKMNLIVKFETTNAAVTGPEIGGYYHSLEYPVDLTGYTISGIQEVRVPIRDMFFLENGEIVRFNSLRNIEKLVVYAKAKEGESLNLEGFGFGIGNIRLERN